MRLFEFFLIILLLMGCQPIEKNPSPPNIILILADDMGYSDLGCTGAEIPTANIDRLAADGLMMPNFYNAARCCPTRASLLTGLYPHQAGMGDMVEGRLWKDSTFLPAYQGWLEEDAITIAEALKQKNYTTLFSGKWHVGNQKEHWPDNRGFDRTFAMLHGAGNYFNMEPWISEDQFMRLHKDGVPFKPGEDFYMTNAITDHALEFMGEIDPTQPFFLYLSYTAPHWPLHALPQDIEKFKGKYMEGWNELREKRFDKMKKLELVPEKAELSPAYFSNALLTPQWDTLSQADKETWDLRMAVYAAQMYRMDHNIGALLEYLGVNNLLDNTLIMFLSDNGATKAAIYLATGWVADRSGPIGSANSFDSYGAGWANASNTPFRLFKHWTNEGGIKTPLIMHWPNQIPAGSKNRSYGHVIDIMPTCLSAAGFTTSELNQIFKIPLEGTDLISRDSSNNEDVLYWEHQGHWAVRKGSWKLLHNHDKDSTGEYALYDISRDPGEMKDLKDLHPELSNRLYQQYLEWEEKVGVKPFDSLILARDI